MIVTLESTAKKYVGQQVHAERVKLKLSQCELAQRIGCTPYVISKMESGEYELHTNCASKIFRCLKLRLDTLMVGFSELQRLKDRAALAAHVAKEVQNYSGS